jgi:hypothetical protein
MMFGYLDLGVVATGAVGASATLWSEWINGLEWVRRILVIASISDVGEAMVQVRFSDGSESQVISLGGIGPTPAMLEYLGAVGTEFRLGISNVTAQAGTCHLVAQAFM